MTLALLLFAAASLAPGVSRCPLHYCSCDNRSVDCSDRRLTNIPTGIAPDTLRLKLDSNHLQALPSDAFRGLFPLTALDLSLNQLSTLPSGVFSNLLNLRELRLSYNAIQSLPSGIFERLSKLEILDLESNQLRSVPPEAFDDLRSLEFLILAENRLACLPDGSLNRLRKLVRADFYGNDWSCSCNSSCGYLSRWIRRNAGKIGDSTLTCDSGKLMEAVECPPWWEDGGTEGTTMIHPADGVQDGAEAAEGDYEGGVEDGAFMLEEELQPSGWAVEGPGGSISAVAMSVAVTLAWW